VYKGLHHLQERRPPHDLQLSHRQDLRVNWCQLVVSQPAGDSSFVVFKPQRSVGVMEQQSAGSRVISSVLCTKTTRARRHSSFPR